MKRTIERIVVLLVYATFFVPLILAPNSFIFPFIVPKVLLFRSLVIAMLCGYALLLIINYEEYRPRFSAVSLALTAFLASFTLSTFFGMDAYHSFWDNHERMLGLFTVVHYVIYYFICTAVLKNWSDWKRALQVFLIAGSIVMFIGVLQKFNQNLLLNQGSDRVASTLGNAIYVGGYGLFLFFVSMLLASREKRFWLKLLYGGFSVLALFGLFFSGTRGSVLGILAGLSTVLIAYSFLLKSNPPLRRVAFYLIAFIVLLSGSLFIFRHNPIIANLPAVGRLLSTSLTNGSSDTRKIAWKIGIEGWQERPIFGWGPNNFFYAFNQFYNPRSLEFGYGETWFDNAHNIIINTLTVQGIFGLLTYLAIFVLAILTLWQSKDREQRLHLIAWGTGFLVAHLVQNITVFENPTSYLYFVFWLALVNRLGSPLFLAVTTAPGVSPAKDRSVGPLAIGSILLVGAALIFVFNIQPARANKKTLTALQALSLDPVKGLAVAKEAIAFNSPHVDDIRGDIARTITDILSNSYQKIGKTEGTELLQTAYAALNANTKLHPADIRTYLLLSQLGQLGFAITQNSQFISDAERYMTIGLSYSPRRQQFLYTLANFKLQLGKKDEAYALMQQALDDDPKILETYWRFAYIYQLSDQNEKARQILALAHERGIPFTDQARQVEQLIVSSTPTKNGK
jgi:O-antigen ligase